MNFSNLNVLIVDDSTQILDAMQGILTELGVASITRALSGEQAQDLILNEEHGFNLIISDQFMEGMTGMQLLQSIRKQFDKVKLPFIMLTSEGTRENIISLVSNGGNNFIVKPPSLDTVKEKIVSTFQS